MLESGGTLSKDDKSVIKQTYFDTFGRFPNVEGKCKNCWKDAIIELIVKLSPSKYRMKFGAVEVYNGIQYGHKNITDEIAKKIIEENPNTQSFYGL